MFDFESLKVYQKSLELIDKVYETTSNFPDSERFGLISQFTRAANSIALNIAEGYGESKSMFIKHIRIAKGSLRECVVCVTIALRQKFINEPIHDNLRSRLTEISKMLSGLQNYVEKQIENKN